MRLVHDLPACVAFYRDVAGQRCTKQTEHWAQFDCGSLRLGLYDATAMAEHLAVDPDRFAAPPAATELAFEVEDVDAAVQAALDAGAPLFAPAADRPWGERTGYVLDPHGAVVEFCKRLPR